jgi:D-serine deaminase-like pyridoxal phosphate-dependent protein
MNTTFLRQEHSVRQDEINTPALLVDLDAMEANLNRMAAFFKDRPANLRPHFKNHKIPLLALKQIRAGAIGITCATVREAEILVHHGIESILIANEVVGATKPLQVAELSKHASVIVAIDSFAGARDLAHAARDRKSRIEIVVDIEIGLKRCGVPTGADALELAKFAVEQGLIFRGIMGYDGHLQALPPSEERDRIVRQGSQWLIDSAQLIGSVGLHVGIVSTGGTGTFSVSGAYPGITEIQAGSYLLMDTLYVKRDSPFQPALTMLATVISKPEHGRAVIDCGLKTVSSERGLPTVKNMPYIHLSTLHAEHGLLEIDTNAAVDIEVGQKIELWVRYSDATVNLNSVLYGVRDSQVEEVFRIER